MTKTTRSTRRGLSGLDHLLSHVDQQLRRFAGERRGTPQSPTRPSPAKGHDEPVLSGREREHAAGLMRVNHTGEVCAQALYRGQAMMARNVDTRDKLLGAAQEEADHLAWCEERIDELGTHASRLNPLFFASSYALGALTGAIGDKVSLGFVHATEEGVAMHLKEHLQKLPTDDRKSQLVLQQMLAEEERHGAHALKQGGEEFSDPVKRMMRTASQVMTKTTYWL